MKPIHKTISNKREVVRMLEGIIGDLARQGHTRADMIGVFSECLFGIAGGFDTSGMEIQIFTDPNGVLGVKVTHTPITEGEPS